MEVFGGSVVSKALFCVRVEPVIPESRAQLSMKAGMTSGCKLVSQQDGFLYRGCWAQNAAAALCCALADSSPSDAAILFDHKRHCSPPTLQSPSWKDLIHDQHFSINKSAAAFSDSPFKWFCLLEFSAIIVLKSLLKYMAGACNMNMDTSYRGEMQVLVLQLRLIALGLLMLTQNILWTIFPSDFLLHPNLVYCFPADTTHVTIKWLLPW